MSTNTPPKYRVIIHEYARRHFIKGFQKKYTGGWTKTLETIRFMLERAESLRHTDQAEIIHTAGQRHIIKGDFSVIGTRESPKSSGNRYIAFVDDEAWICEILLIYSKNDIVGDHETIWWKGLIQENVSEIMRDFR